MFAASDQRMYAQPSLNPSGLKKKMLYCPLGAKTWVGQSEIFIFPPFSLFGLIFLSFDGLIFNFFFSLWADIFQF